MPEWISSVWKTKRKRMTTAAITMKTKSPLSRPFVRHERRQEPVGYGCPVLHGGRSFHFALSERLVTNTDKEFEASALNRQRRTP